MRGHRAVRHGIGAAVLAATLWSSVAHADAPQLAQARAAIDEVRYDDAQRLLIAALEAGGNSPAAVHDIYELLGASAVALGKTDDAEKYYRAWIALDPKAALDAGVSPKLRAPFDAAKSFVAANGPLDVAAEFVSDSDVRLRVISDPLALARSARMRDEGAAASIVDRGALVRGRGTAVLVLDRYGNTLVELAPTGAPPTPTRLPDGPTPTGATAPIYSRDVGPRVDSPAKRSTAFYALAIPTGLLLGTGMGFGIASIVYSGQVQVAVEDSGGYYYDDVVDKQKKTTLFWKLSAIVGGAGLVLAIPTAILYTRSHDTTVVPFVDGTSAGAAVSGRF